MGKVVSTVHAVGSLMTELPLWAVCLVAFGTPLSALGGVLLSQWLTRRTAKELGSRAKREELMRNLRWAAELAVSKDEDKSELGVAQLTALGESDLLDAGDQVFVDAALASVIREPQEEIDAIEAAGQAAEVVADVNDPTGLTPGSASALLLAADRDEGEVADRED
ncbi:hypothetical protein [uncultured Friedmanniella sp.]|uniref:hypothetical protein n=1 Tax=uncultured Friedmanniella sp. TaxID=335381 RepID=UPI0035CA2D29